MVPRFSATVDCYRAVFEKYISAILSQTENPDQDGNAWYLPRPDRNITSESEVFVDGFLIFISMLIILQVLIPVSLYVTLEIVKLGQVSLKSTFGFEVVTLGGNLE